MLAERRPRGCDVFVLAGHRDGGPIFRVSGAVRRLSAVVGLCGWNVELILGPGAGGVDVVGDGGRASPYATGRLDRLGVFLLGLGGHDEREAPAVLGESGTDLFQHPYSFDGPAAPLSSGCGHVKDGSERLPPIECGL